MGGSLGFAPRRQRNHGALKGATPGPCTTRQAFYAFGIFGAVTILGYVYVEADHALLMRLMTMTRFGKIVLSVPQRKKWYVNITQILGG